jgi:hypothetical protein
MQQMADAVFPFSLGDAVRYFMGQPPHQRETLEILIAPYQDEPVRVLHPGEIEQMYEQWKREHQPCE